MLKVIDFLADAVVALSKGSYDSSCGVSFNAQSIDNQCVAVGGYPEKEAEAIAVRLCEEVLGVKSWQWVLEPSMEIPPDDVARLSSSLRRLCTGEPLQYVLGYADFCGFRFNVSPSVLIPRPETEELCRLVVQEMEGLAGASPAGGFFQDGSSSEGFSPVLECGAKGLRIMDLCTGSGCIAWSLALLLPRAEVFGVDVSEEALSVARTQPLGEEVARRGAIVPKFYSCDILSEISSSNVGVSSFPEASPRGSDESSYFGAGSPPAGDLDIIVSNPPYVLESERAALPSNVRGHEPDLALFVPDSDPLLFYKAIANFSVKRLRIGGFGFVEINEAFGEATAAIFSSAGFSSVKILTDFRAKFRFVSFKK